MLRPDFKEFTRLAGEATLVPVAKSITADLLTPVSAFLALAGEEPGSFLLESIEAGERIGRYSFLGARPYMQVQSRGTEIMVERRGRVERRAGNIFEIVQQMLRQHRAAVVPDLPPFTAGAVGYFAYDIVRQLEKIGDHTKDDLRAPDCALMFYDRLLAFDHLRHQIHIIAAADVSRESPKRAYERALRDIAAIERKLSAGLRRLRPRAAHRFSGPLKVRHRTSRTDYMRGVERMKEYIAAGDIFQAVLSQRL
ncbi:MAG TPA: anthranilate synthase component I, partial [Terriglobales bacterium]|nr:anthranilate synthase component I [Terriglobales bacterium]